ncbi:MAG: precorrin-8X methylmutase [Candidatus Hydrothermarchaeaceae archaeon]
MNAKEIEEESFRIIEKQLDFPYPEKAVVRRIIHATADFSFADTVVFSGNAIQSGVDAVKSGTPIITDVNMVRAGISRYTGEVKCFISDAGVRELAENSDMTRTASAFRMFKDELQDAIVAIGNAPTALFELCTLIEEGITPSLVVAAPVGFVGAKESKEEILKHDIPCIAVRGQRGGSSVAAAIVNALIRLAEE